MAAVAAGSPCADAATSLTFAGAGVSPGSQCTAYDDLTLGHLLRGLDRGKAAADRVLDGHGGLQLRYRESGMVVAVKLVYQNPVGWWSTPLAYSYEAHLLNTARAL
jgi:hypothetical protein